MDPQDLKDAGPLATAFGALLAFVASLGGAFVTVRRQGKTNATDIQMLKKSCVTREKLHDELKIIKLQLGAYNRVLARQTKIHQSNHDNIEKIVAVLNRQKGDKKGDRNVTD